MKRYANRVAGRERLSQRGFTMVELMVGMLIGLLAVIVISQVMLISEGQKRTTTGGSDAQVNGALALYALQRDVEMAGYGITSSPGVIGCPISARFNGAVPAGFAARLVPVVITKEADRAAGSVGDSVRILASSKTTFAVPTRVVPPKYVAGSLSFPVTASLGIKKDDLALAAKDDTSPCWVFQASANPTSEAVPRANNDAGWNLTGKPDVDYEDGSVLINLGSLVDNSYQIVGNTLQQESFDLSSPNNRPTRDVQPDIVNMRALYGKDTTVPADGVVDVYDDVTPLNNTQWQQVIAIRIVVVARSDQLEKEDVTPANLRWDVGTTPSTTGAAACGGSECLTLKIDHLPDWKRYRYKQFETVIPLRNMLWKS